jgi:hypothetical protein
MLVVVLPLCLSMDNGEAVDNASGGGSGDCGGSGG